MVVTAMLGAVTALLTFTPVGMIMLPPPLPAVTLVHIPVILAALAEGPWVGVLVGLIFGLCSLIRAWGTGMVGLTLFFRNPLVSVLPRMLIPLAAWAAYRLWGTLFKRKNAVDKLGAGVAAAIGAATNTVLCLGMIVILYGTDLTVLVNNLISTGNAGNAYLDNAGAWLVAVVGLPNGLAEAAVAAVLIPMLKTAVDAVTRRNRRKAMPTQQSATLQTETSQAVASQTEASLTEASQSAALQAAAPQLATPQTAAAQADAPDAEMSTFSSRQPDDAPGAREPAESPRE